MAKTGYLGPAGSFTDAAAKAFLPDDERIPFRSIPDAIDAVKLGKVDRTVVPMENAIEGSVNITLDYFIHYQRMNMAGEVIAPIEQHLLTAREQADSWQDVEIVYSHPQAIAQCHQFLRNMLPDAEVAYVNSTAEAAKYVAEHPEENAAAIANEVAAAAYGAEIVHRKINDYANNQTRFLLLTNEDRVYTEEETAGLSFKTTLMIGLSSDFSGALHQVLAAFAWRKINLTKIESRPTKTGLGNYFFIIDVDMDYDTVLLPSVCEELRALGCDVQVLGSYPCFTWEALTGKTPPVSKN
ncbi:prephenate dehydratase [Salisediminibacterium halotolerans]|uniref:prephenate dehydratase n=1 Tax=Salisediminibacterium halotolerans TaxID=517425 RepID=UPI000EB10207|nr:prephenate dehydratase [Salisediminibacterium halotolerans]RLJ78395.1 prephenate dehydratase [Actinophytocola xinjiangensis]RPE88263.1 prephenate dehydratase [Salisediminibacterium halotolerans]TWG37371.1 prephenate dehydratase [Salisediminibacterium halotolerans]GEL06836.1 prephenate dehydratase [Salisediminibacterium halotolerans]